MLKARVEGPKELTVAGHLVGRCCKGSTGQGQHSLLEVSIEGNVRREDSGGRRQESLGKCRFGFLNVLQTPDTRAESGKTHKVSVHFEVKPLICRSLRFSAVPGLSLAPHADSARCRLSG